MSRRHAALILIAALTLVACRSGESTPAPVSPTAPIAPTVAAAVDPSATGPYAVGLRRLTFERPSTADGTPRVLDTWVWYPATGAPGGDVIGDAPVAGSGGPFPIVIYSHGSGGRPDFQQFLTVHLASHGFVVAAPPHPGNTNDDCFPCTTASILPSARERPEDVTFVLDELIALNGDPASDVGRIIDPERTAIVGHSFGGWTALYVAADDRFDAAVAQAPGSPQLLRQRGAGVETPLMIIASEQDEVEPIENVYDYWEGLGATEKRFVLLPEGVHLTYVDRCFGCRDGLPEDRGHELVRRYTTAWLYVHVLGDARYAPYLEPDPPDAVLTP